MVAAQEFVLANETADLVFSHQNNEALSKEAGDIAAGGAVGDYNLDGYPDFYLIGGSNQSNALFKNNGDGTFSNLATQANVALYDILGSGPVFADVDGDADLDLLVFSIHDESQPQGSDPDLLKNRPRLFINQNDGTFIDASNNSGFYSGMPSYSGSFADFDQDGDLDLFMTHWSASGYTTSKQLFWLNDGTGQFTDATIAVLGLPQNANTEKWMFTPHITDINQDGWLDVLLASDFGTTRIFYSEGVLGGQLSFYQSQPPVITDENGMGLAVADYDNDGDLDWFVTSIWDPDGMPEGNWGVTGNRLYKNTGNGTFIDVTSEAGVREGYWGWGACFADFNNDGYLDIFHVNGFTSIPNAADFLNDPSRLFIANDDGTFTESSSSAGINYTGQGRGISCVDYDLDGNLDILIMPNKDSYQLYKNVTSNNNNYTAIKLFDKGSNPFAIGSKIKLFTASMTHLREVSSSNNFVSNNPLQQHIGLGSATIINKIEITWPDGELHTITDNITANQITSIGRYCHTKFFSSVTNNSTQSNVDIYLHDENGTAIQSSEVTLTVEQGPNQGLNISTLTDVSGKATFSLESNSDRTDRLLFSFNFNTEPYICRAVINWNVDTIFIDGFE